MRILIFSAFLRAFRQAQTGQNRFLQLFAPCNFLCSNVLSATNNINVLHSLIFNNVVRSEERRVGKEWRRRWARYDKKENMGRRKGEGKQGRSEHMSSERE